MSKIQDIDTASKVAEANGAMSYREWAGMHMYSGQKTAIGGVAGLIGGGLLGLAFPAYAIALAAGGAVVGAAGGFVQSSMSAVSPKMVESYINYVNVSNEAVEKTRQLNLSIPTPNQNTQTLEGANVERLKTQANLATGRNR